jgi:hypothetical protein
MLTLEVFLEMIVFRGKNLTRQFKRNLNTQPIIAELIPIQKKNSFPSLRFWAAFSLRFSLRFWLRFLLRFHITYSRRCATLKTSEVV